MSFAVAKILRCYSRELFFPQARKIVYMYVCVYVYIRYYMYYILLFVVCSSVCRQHSPARHVCEARVRALPEPTQGWGAGQLAWPPAPLPGEPSTALKMFSYFPLYVVYF